MQLFNTNKIFFVLRFFYVAAILNMVGYQTVYAVGLMPVPIFNTFDVSATASFDVNTNRYSYNYSFTNPAVNTGNVWHIKIDITQQGNSLWNFTGLTIPFGTKEINFIDMYNSRKPFALPPGTGVVPIGQKIPTGWVGGFGRDGTASFAAGDSTLMIEPGTTKSGFMIVSPGLPTIRKMEVIPHWVVLVENHGDITFEERDAAAVINKNIRFNTYTIGPAGNVTEGSFEHWNLVRDNVTKAIELNWIKDQDFTTSLLEKLQNARLSANNQDGKSARIILNEALVLLSGTTITQRNQEIHDLIFYHLQSLIKYTYDILPRFEPSITISPVSTKLSIGTLHTITAKVVNLADYNAPVSGYDLYFHIDNGPHSGLSLDGVTDVNGELEFKYMGTKSGKDHVVVEELGD